jgi:fructose/tagatose bisphosphate aldolase
LRSCALTFASARAFVAHADPGLLTSLYPAQSKEHITRATACGVAVEVELGRLEGGEAGLRVITDAQLTNPDKAEHFMKESGATLLAPSIGNLHGKYLSPPENQFKLDLYAPRLPRCTCITDR